MQGRCRLPGLVAHAGYELAHSARWAQRNAPAVARDDIAIGRKAGCLDLQPFHRGVYEPHRAAGCAFFSHDMPRLECLPQLDFDPGGGELAVPGEAELEMRREPFLAQREARRALLFEYVGEILLDEIREHEAVVQLGAPA